jgi:hypothetical protein
MAAEYSLSRTDEFPLRSRVPSPTEKFHTPAEKFPVVDKEFRTFAKNHWLRWKKALCSDEKKFPARVEKVPCSNQAGNSRICVYCAEWQQDLTAGHYRVGWKLETSSAK